MAILFAVTDPNSYRVVCDADWWGEHIELHAEMVGREAWVQETIRAPIAVYASATHPSRSIFHRQYQFGGLLGRSFVRVVVEYRRSRLGDPLEGVVITAFAASGPKAGEVLVWPRQELSGSQGLN